LADPAPFSFETREEKKSYVEHMFGQIAHRYDFFNHFLSLGFDYAWRRRAIEVLRSRLPVEITNYELRITNDNSPAESNTQIPDSIRNSQFVIRNSPPGPRILDIACGTGDLAFEALKQMPDAAMTGVDLTQPMLDLFRKKAEEKNAIITIERGDVEHLEFPDNTFDGVTIGFGTRNFTNLSIAFSEIYRVLKPEGVFVNLELAKPRVFPMKQLYNFYFNVLLPLIGTLFSGHNSAYKYLPDSLRKFPDLEALAALMEEAGFQNVRWETRTAGIVAIHSGVK
jgi:demethylmenaquinone methyltransferase/2-methoxy-6-polyprenyl-1,4-benzoquinol methylase